MKALRIFLSATDGRIVSQMSMAKQLGVSQRQVSAWESDQHHGATSYRKIADAINLRLFPNEKLFITADDVASKDLVTIIRNQIDKALSDKEGQRTTTEIHLQELLENTLLCKALRIDDDLTAKLKKLAASLRDDLDVGDWSEVARIVREGLEATELWKYQARDARRLELIYKAPRALTTVEKARFEKLAQGWIDEIAKEERKKGKDEKSEIKNPKAES